jgi:hypothetical protein
VKLKISGAFEQKFYALHDGSVEFIQYEGEGNNLTIEVTLSGDSNDKLGWFGELIFHQVKILQSKPVLEKIDWNMVARSNIASSDYKPENNEGNLEAVFWAVDLYLEPDGQSEWLILEFLAESFEWIPDRSRKSPYIEG